MALLEGNRCRAEGVGSAGRQPNSSVPGKMPCGRCAVDSAAPRPQGRSGADSERQGSQGACREAGALGSVRRWGGGVLGRA